MYSGGHARTFRTRIESDSHFNSNKSQTDQLKCSVGIDEALFKFPGFQDLEMQVGPSGWGNISLMTTNLVIVLERIALKARLMQGRGAELY
eukprot:1106080-Amphidinium_carterae.1